MSVHAPIGAGRHSRPYTARKKVNGSSERGNVLEPDDQICYCFHISKRKVLNFIRIHQPRVASQISECGGAGTGCGWCIPFLKKYYAQSQGGRSEELADLTPEEYAARRGNYIRSGGGVPPPGATPPPDAG